MAGLERLSFWSQSRVSLRNPPQGLFGLLQGKQKEYRASNKLTRPLSDLQNISTPAGAPHHQKKTKRQAGGIEEEDRMTKPPFCLQGNSETWVAPSCSFAYSRKKTPARFMVSRAGHAPEPLGFISLRKNRGRRWGPSARRWSCSPAA